MPNQDVEALVSLGLSAFQSKIYLTLLKVDEANVLTIAKTSNVARQEIYRVIGELQNRGLVEKVLAKPVRYKAVPIEQIVPNLLLRINEEKSRAHNKAMQLLERHRNRKTKMLDHEKVDSFLLISENTALSSRIRNAIEVTQKSMKLVTPGNKFVPALFDLAGYLQAALERGLTIKWLINKRLNRDEAPAVLSKLLKFPNFKLRYISGASLLTFGLYDSNSLLVATDPKLNYCRSQALCTNVFPFLELANNYFDTLWINSVEIEHK